MYMNISTIYLTFVCLQGFVCALFYFAVIRRAVLVLHLFLMIYECMHCAPYNPEVHPHKVTWLTSEAFTSRITMSSCFTFPAEDRASFMILTLSCHFPALSMLMWKMPLSLTRTSIHSLEGGKFQIDLPTF